MANKETLYVNIVPQVDYMYQDGSADVTQKTVSAYRIKENKLVEVYSGTLNFEADSYATIFDDTQEFCEKYPYTSSETYKKQFSKWKSDTEFIDL